MIECKCGCGEELEEMDKCGRPRKYINGHSNRGETNPFYGKHHSKETLIKLRKPKSEESKRKNSESHRGKPSPMKGISRSKETKLKISEVRIAREVAKGEKNPMYGIRFWGNNNPNWKGGISFLPYCLKFNKYLKESIRQRDNYACQLCDKTQQEEGRKLSTHHIHYDKENCNPDLITLCKSCNGKVNGNRKQYEILFMNKLNERELLFWSKKVEL